MVHHNFESIWRKIALGVLLASTITLLACGAARTMPGGSMPGGGTGGTMPVGTTPSGGTGGTTSGGGMGGTMPGGMGQHPMSHPRPHP